MSQLRSFTPSYLQGPNSQALIIAPILRAPVVIGPVLVTQGGGVIVEEITSTLHSRAAPLALVSAITKGRGRTFQDTLNDAGASAFVLSGSDPVAGMITEEMIVRHYVDGIPAFDAFMEQVDITTLVQGEEHDQNFAFSGRNKICVFEEAVVYPSYAPGSLPVEDDRTFDWTLPQYDDSAWGFATELCTVGFAQSNWPFLPFASGWKDTATKVLWSPDGSFLNALPGTNYFRDTFTVATAGIHILHFVADNGGTVYVDGIRPAAFDISAFDDFSNTHSVVLELSAGTHNVAVVATNNNEPLNPSNPGGIAVAIYASADANNTPGTLVWSSSAAMKILVRPGSVPGMTLGRILRLVKEEAQARGAIPEITLGFTDFVDSNGNAWVIPVAAPSTKVGTDLLTFLRELSGTHIDFWMPPGDFVLNAAAKDTHGSSLTVNLGAPTDPTDPTTGAITKLTHRRRV